MDLVDISDRIDLLESKLTEETADVPHHIAIGQTRTLLEIAIVLVDIRDKLASISERMPLED
jgi:hypothetical protein